MSYLFPYYRRKKTWKIFLGSKIYFRQKNYKIKSVKNMIFYILNFYFKKQYLDEDFFKWLANSLLFYSVYYNYEKYMFLSILNSA